jgi:hypothetical protein
MKISELITDPTTGCISHTKVWTNIAYATTTGVFIMQAYKATLTPDIWLIYLAVVGAHNVASKMITAKYGNATPTA